MGNDPTMSAPTAPTDRANRHALLIVFLVVVIDLLGFGIVVPLLPRYAEEYIDAVFPGQADTWVGGLIIGLLMASFSAMQFIFAPIWGRVSDRIGRRPILLVGLAGSVVFYTLFGYASALSHDTAETARFALILLFIARIGAGIAGATISTAQAVIADCTTPEKRKHGMALIGAAFGIGFTLGPLVGFASVWKFPDYHGAIGYTAAGLSLVALVLGVILMPETRNFGTAPPLDRRWIDLGALRSTLSTPAIAPIILAFFMATLGFASFESTLALLNKDALGLEKKYNFLVFAYVGFVLLLTQGYLYRKLAKKLDEPTLMTIGICLMGLGVMLLGGVTYASFEKLAIRDILLTALLISLAISVVGFAFLTPSAQALISRRTDPARQGEVLGVNQSASALARIIGPILGLGLYKATSTHLLPYVLGGALVLLMLPVMPLIRRHGSATGG